MFCLLRFLLLNKTTFGLPFAGKSYFEHCLIERFKKEDWISSLFCTILYFRSWLVFIFKKKKNSQSWHLLIVWDNLNELQFPFIILQLKILTKINWSQCFCFNNIRTWPTLNCIIISMMRREINSLTNF